MKNTDKYKAALHQYKQSLKNFSSRVKKNEYGNEIVEEAIKKSPALYGPITLEVSRLDIGQLLSRANLFNESIKDSHYIESLKGHANLFSRQNLKRSYPEEGSTDKENSNESDKENIENRKKLKKSGKIGGIHPDAPEDILENYRESSALFDDDQDSEKMEHVGQLRERQYHDKIQKLIKEDPGLSKTAEKHVSFASNNVLQRQLLEVSNARSGKNFLPGEKKVFVDSPYMSEEGKRSIMTIHHPNVRSKNKTGRSK
jgi:hypothetical protein